MLLNSLHQWKGILREIQLYGNPQTMKPVDQTGKLFGEVAQQWFKIISTEIRSCTLGDYRYSMNHYILPKFGNTPIGEISYLTIRTFVSELAC